MVERIDVCETGIMELKDEEEALSAIQSVDTDAKSLRLSSGVMGVIFLAGAFLAKMNDQQHLADLAMVAATYTAMSAFLGDIQHTFLEGDIFISQQAIKKIQDDS